MLNISLQVLKSLTFYRTQSKINPFIPNLIFYLMRKLYILIYSGNWSYTGSLIYIALRDQWWRQFDKYIKVDIDLAHLAKFDCIFEHLRMTADRQPNTQFRYILVNIFTCQTFCMNSVQPFRWSRHTWQTAQQGTHTPIFNLAKNRVQINPQPIECKIKLHTSAVVSLLSSYQHILASSACSCRRAQLVFGDGTLYQFNCCFAQDYSRLISRYSRPKELVSDRKHLVIYAQKLHK